MFGILYISFLISNAQINPENQLEIVYLNKNVKEVVYVNSYSNFNANLIVANEINFKNQVQKNSQDNDHFLFLSERRHLKTPTVSYLKTTHKEVNQIIDYKHLKPSINKKPPELTNQFKKDNDLEELYIISRKNTFNGEINALTSVL
jgi:hypothetical protein